MADVVAEEALIEVLLNKTLEGFDMVGVSQKGDEEVADLILIIWAEAHKGKGFFD